MRLDLLHFPHVAKRRLGERGGRELDEDGEHDDRHAVVPGDRLQQMKRPQQWNGDEPEPSEIERAVEVAAGACQDGPILRADEDRRGGPPVDHRHVDTDDWYLGGGRHDHLTPGVRGHRRAHEILRGESGPGAVGQRDGLPCEVGR